MRKKNLFKDTPKWNIHSRSIFERFAAQLEEYSKGGVIPELADEDVADMLAAQRKRLEDRELSLTYAFKPRGHFSNRGGVGMSWSDAKYTSTMEYRSCEMTKTVTRKDRKIYRKKQNMLFYGTLVHMLDSRVAENDPYTCPNCGAISTIKELQEKCPYCDTHFEMSQLFPKVTNYYLLKDFGGTQAEVKISVMNTVLPFMVVCAAIFIWALVIAKTYPHWILAVIVGALAGAFLGGITGYFFWAIRMLASLFLEAGKSIVLLLDAAGSRKRFVRSMKEHSPEFSYEYFSGKVTAMMQHILFAEEPEKLVFYKGGALPARIQNIVESSFTGAVALKGFQVVGEECRVRVRVHLDNLYQRGKRISRRRDVFTVCLSKNIAKPVNLHFSIRKIQCESCHTSFDATKTRCCPSCGREYDLAQEDWIITSIKG